MLIFLYGLASYAFFFVTFLYLTGFVFRLVVPRTLASAGGGSVGEAVLIDVVLVALFAVQHTIMARPAFKKRWTRWVPVAAERSTFVLLATALVASLMWQWQLIEGHLWRVDAAWARWLLTGLSLGGFVLALFASFLIDHFDLFGLRQVKFHLRNRPYSPPRFQTPWLYRRVRNPLMLGFLIAF